MAGTPDVAGLPLNEALQICKDAGYEVDIVITRPVKATPGGEQRVVRFNRVSESKGVLTVVCEDKGRGGG
jgi:hypothetical protein